MKSKISRKGLSKLVVVMLIFVMIATSACSGFINTDRNKGPIQSGSDSSAGGNVDHTVALDNLNEDLVIKQESISDDERVNYIIEVDDDSLFTMYEGRKDTRISYQDFVATRSSRINAENISKKHQAMYSQIAKKIDARFVLSYTGILNAFAVNIRYGDRDALKSAAKNSGALSVSISERYEMPATVEVSTPAYVEVDNEVPAHATGIFQRPDGEDTDGNDLAKYQGEGLVVAVLDTGLDYEHDAFTNNYNLPILKDAQGNEVMENGKPKVDDSKLKFQEDHLTAEKMSALTATSFSKYSPFDYNPDYTLDEKFAFTDRLSASEVYVNKKVPFAYDYADFDPEVNTSQNNSHGTHVSGIIVGRSNQPYLRDKNGDYVDKNGRVLGPFKFNLDGSFAKDDNGNFLSADGNVLAAKDSPVERKDVQGRTLTGIEGVAPLAQIIFMKIFSDFSGGAEDIFVFAALSDCATLGVDVVNLSIGRGSGFSDMNEIMIQQKAFENLNELGVNIIVAGSNGYNSAMGGHYGTNLLSNPDSATLGSPASIHENFAVASINGVKAQYIMGQDAEGTDVGAVFINESSKGGLAHYDFIDDLTAAILGDNKNSIVYGSHIAYTKNNTDVPYLKETGKDANNKPIYSTDEINIPFVQIPGYGRLIDYGSAVVEGKIVLVSRGVNTFVEKLQVARDQGALGVICYNNVGGIITMSLDENDVKLPSCSITMDEAAPLKEHSNGIFYINRNEQKAGPFMSEFSSWGPLPGLELKPEITGHGGEIYSSYPGNNYNRISGTSMACPNIAGLTILARQHIMAHPDIYPGITGDGSKADNQKIQTIIYQMMMSTATVPMNKDNNPYSPRKVGAGLADINAMLRTRAFLVVKEEAATEAERQDKARTKIELYDDYEKTGVYEMDFYVRNMSDNDYVYTASSRVFTESVASDKKTVAEKAYLLESGKREWKVGDATTWTTGNTMTVVAKAPTGGAEYADTKITLRVTLTQTEKDYFEVFENGMYVEGFVQLTPSTTDTVTAGDSGAQALGVPFLAFYGDWFDAPIFDEEVYVTDKDDKDDSKNEEQKTYSQGRPLQAYGRFEIDGADYVLPLGPFLFGVPEDAYGNPIYPIPYATHDRTVLSLSRNSLCELYFVTGFLRGVRYAEWNIRDKTTGKLMDTGDFINVRKDALASNIGGLAMELDVAEIGCKSGGTYVFEMTAEIDPNHERSQSQSWSFEFSIDTDAPIITDSQLRVEKSLVGSGYNYYLDLYIYDEFYAQAMTLNIFSNRTGQYESVWESGLRPIGGEKNSTTRISYNLTSYWEYIKDNGYKVATQIYDYAFNASHYEINLEELLYTAAHDTLKLGEIGSYKTYTSGSRDMKVFDSEFSEVKYADDGSFEEMTEIYVVKNQVINLGNALITDSNVWPSDIIWRSSKDEIKINDKGELIVQSNDATQDIMVTVSATSKTTGLAATMTVWVLSDKTVADFEISTIRENTIRLSGVGFKSASRNLNAGESYEVELELTPWFTSSDDIVVEWNTDNRLVATIRPNSQNPLKATVIARQGIYKGDYMPDYSVGVHSSLTAPVTTEKCEEDYITNFHGGASIMVTVYNKNTPHLQYNKKMSVYVYKEFISNGPMLLEYHGSRPDVVIPESLGLTSVAERCFMSNQTVEKLVLPEGIERVGMASFAYCPKLKEVVFPSSMRVIGEYAFIGAYSARDGLNTALQVVDTTRVAQPLHIEGKSFINNPCIGSNSVIKENAFIPSPVGSGWKLLDAKLDTSMFRVVGEKAFSGCGFALGSNSTLDLSGIRTMGESAFSSIGRFAYEYDKTAKMTVILGERTDIGENGLSQSGVTSLEIKSTRLGISAFKDCANLKDVVFKADNVYVSASAFEGCSNLTDVEFEGSVNYIGESAFAGTSKLTNLKFNEVKGAKYIGDYAFRGAPLMERLVLPVNLEYLGTDAFSGRVNSSGAILSNITTLVIPANFTSKVSNFSSLYNTQFEFIEVESGNEYYYVDVNENILYMDEDGKNRGSDDLTLVLMPMLKSDFILDGGVYKLPDSVKKVSDSAFSFNPNLTKVDLNNAKEIAPGAMQNMKSLEQVWLAEGTKVIPDYMFSGCESLTSVHNAEEVTRVGKYAFAGTVDELYMIRDAAGKLSETYTYYDYSKKSNVTEAVTLETPGAFMVVEVNLMPLTDINLRDCVEIGEGAFSATALRSFDIPEGVTEIAPYAFYFCLNLENVTFHNDITDIYDYAFYMSGIKSVTGDTNGIEYVGEFAFAYPEFEKFVRNENGIGGNLVDLRPALESVELANVERIGMHSFSAYYGGGRLSNVVMPVLEEIGAYAFEYQIGVKSISASPVTTLTTIGDYAFASTGMTALNMPNVKYIGRGAFYDCANLKGTAVIPKNVEHIAPLAFAYTEITEFKKETGGNYLVKDGVLFRIYGSEELNTLELTHYPTGNGRKGLTEGVDASNGVTGKSVYTIPAKIGEVEVVKVGESAFSTVRTLSRIVLPETIKTIGDKAFFGSAIKTYEFTSFIAPVLEAYYDGYIMDETHQYYWALYANFYSYFSPTSETYSWTTEGLAHKNKDSEGNIVIPILTINSALYQYRYNTITSKSSSDTWIYGEYVDSSDKDQPNLINKIGYIPATDDSPARLASFGANNSITGGGDMTDIFKYDLTIVRPANGVGYTDFLYNYYFDNTLLSRAHMTENIQSVVNAIAALPAPGDITRENLAASREAVNRAREVYEFLPEYDKLEVENYQDLVDCENAIKAILDSIVSYSVVFMANNKIHSTIQKVESGGLVALPTAPAPETGFLFEGWYLNGVKFNASTPVTADMVLVARFVSDNFYTVSFRGVGVNIESQFIQAGQLVEKPEDPTRDGYKFNGWYTEEGKFDFGSEVDSDLTLYAEWTAKGRGCGTVSPFMGNGTALLIGLATLFTLVALSAVVILKKRPAAHNA